MPNRGLICKMHCAIITEEDPIQINCAMYYTEKNPFEVVFMSEQETEDGEPTQWHYARDLLVQALNGAHGRMYGEGDVQVFKENQFLYTILQRDDAMTVLAFVETDMRIFVDETAKVVPIGEETLPEGDIDRALRDLLGE